MGETTDVLVRKLHGWGNDFLVVLDVDQGDDTLAGADVGALAVALCDRRRGIGADGLIHGARSPHDDVDVVMSLYNADGTRAEMSGNGIRCLAHAVALAGGVWRDTVVADTDVGRRSMTLSTDTTTDGAGVPAVVQVRVPMGSVTPLPSAPGADQLGEVLGSARTAAVDVGNPHLVVLVDDPEAIDVAGLGPVVEALFVDGVNVEFIAPDGADGLRLRVLERGVGITEACGTGACAAAAVAADWGLVGSVCDVHMLGGTAHVALDMGESVLTGPSQLVGTIEVEAG